jgi:hypothetical protein
MKVLKEVTENWTTDFLPNHTYLFEGDKVIAYKPWHDDPVQVLTRPMRFDKARRKFEELEYRAEDWPGVEEQKNTVTVEGSKGNTYEVDLDEGSCTCPGFQFRGKCKHVELAKSSLALKAA